MRKRKFLINALQPCRRHVAPIQHHQTPRKYIIPIDFRYCLL